MGEKTRSEQAQQVFRQFAWNLAGKLADSKQRGPAKPQPRSGGAKR